MILTEVQKKNLPQRALSVIVAISVPNKWQEQWLSKHEAAARKDQHISQTLGRSRKHGNRGSQ